MFERFKRDGSTTRETTSRGSTAVADRPVPPHNGSTTRTHVRADQEQMHAIRARQRSGAHAKLGVVGLVVAEISNALL